MYIHIHKLYSLQQLLDHNMPTEVHIPKHDLVQFCSQTWVTSESQEPSKIPCLDSFCYLVQSYNFKRFLDLSITRSPPRKASPETSCFPLYQ